MTVTLNAGHEQVRLIELDAGRRIGIGLGNDLRDLNRAIIHEFASGGATALAVLASQVGVWCPTATTYAELTRAKVGLWGNGARVRFHVFCQQSRVRVTLGGVVLGTAAVLTALGAWASLPVATLAGAVFDANGMCDLLVESQDTTGVPTVTPLVYHFILCEEKMLLASLPAASNTETLFRACHDELYNSISKPVDAHALQMLDDNARYATWERSRRCCALFSSSDDLRKMRLSSVHWRLDGPYVIEVPPSFSDTMTCNVSIKRDSSPAADFQFFALSEFDDFETARLARTQTLTNNTATHATFTGLAARAGRANMVWVAYKSSIVSTIVASPFVYNWTAQTPWRLMCSRVAALETAGASPEGVPWGWCIVAEGEFIAGDKDPTMKAGLSFDKPGQMCDIATMQGVDNSTGGTTVPTMMLSISPHPGTGITSVPDFNAVWQNWSGGSGNTSFTPTIDIKRCSVAVLTGVYIQASGVVAPTRRVASVPGAPPSAGSMADVVAATNNLVYNGNSQCLIRHSGQRNYRDPVVIPVSGQTTTWGGTYYFVGDGGPGYYQVPIAEPNISGGLGNLTLWGQFFLMGTIGDARTNPAEQNEILYQCRFVTMGSGGWVPGSLRAVKGGGASQMVGRPTEADALVAMTSISNEVGSSPLQQSVNAYGQCNTWPREGSQRGMVWERGILFKDTTQPTFPVVLEAEIQALGGTKYAAGAYLIVAGLSVWWGPRES